jgi:hypothetical protein
MSGCTLVQHMQWVHHSAADNEWVHPSAADNEWVHPSAAHAVELPSNIV